MQQLTNQQERLSWLIDWLIEDDPRWAEARAAGELEVSAGAAERYRLYRSLVNVRGPKAVSAEYLEVEDAYLQEALRRRGAVGLDEVRAASAAAGVPGPDILLWQGDITRLATGGIVNAANSQLLGCFAPCHGCIDNAIHTAAGVRLRLACAELMAAQGAPERTGQAKLTPGFNLPAACVLHTVGPIVRGPRPTARNRADLASCYRACLDAAAAAGLRSAAFCCISTGEFRFPQREAARIAVDTVRGWQERARAAAETGDASAGAAPAPGAAPAAAAPAPGVAPAPVPTVVFNVFKDEDMAIYQRLLQ